MAWKPINRRTFLAGAAKTAIYLPLLEAMFPSDLAVAQASTSYKRFVYMLFPNGTVGYEMSPTSIDSLTGMLAPLSPLKDHLLFINGLTNRDNSTWEKNLAPAGGGSPHEFAEATFMAALTTKDRTNLRHHITIDQVIGKHLQGLYRNPTTSVLINDGTVETGMGQLDTNMAWHQLISWKSETEYVSPLGHPTLVFNSLFSNAKAGGGTTTDAQLAFIKIQKRSILDSALSQISEMNKRLGAADKVRLDRYLAGVRDVETKVNAIATEVPSATCQIPTRPATGDYSFVNYTKTVLDLMVLGLQCQTTPMIVYQLSRGNGGARTAEYCGVSDDQHDITHDEGRETDRRKINTWYNMQFAYFLQKLANTQELGVPLIQNVLTLYGSGISSSVPHDGSNLPIVLAGGQSMGVKTRQIINFAAERPYTPYGAGTRLANLHLSMAQLAGMNITSFGNSNGVINLK
jgi:hypothetical protein